MPALLEPPDDRRQPQRGDTMLGKFFNGDERDNNDITCDRETMIRDRMAAQRISGRFCIRRAAI